LSGTLEAPHHAVRLSRSFFATFRSLSFRHQRQCEIIAIAGFVITLEIVLPMVMEEPSVRLLTVPAIGVAAVLLITAKSWVAMSSFSPPTQVGIAYFAASASRFGVRTLAN
jgi:hypothetical protein